MALDQSKPALFRPVEINTTNNTLYIRPNDTGLQRTCVIASGLYASIISVAYAFQQRINIELGLGGSVVVIQFTEDLGQGIDYGFRITVELDPINTDDVNVDKFKLDLNDGLSEVDDLLGYPGFTAEFPTYVSSITFPASPLYMWIPQYQNANQDRFHLEQNKTWRGIETKSGGLAGITTGPLVHRRGLDFSNETSQNVVKEGALTTYDWKRTHDYFAHWCRASYPVDATNGKTNGFWFVPDWNSIDISGGLFPRGIIGVSTAGEGIEFDLTTTPDKWVYCQLDTSANRPITASIPTSRSRYALSMEIHEDTDPPTFIDPDPS